MADYDNTNRGALWRNTKKEKDTQPDHTGKLNVDGKDYWLSAWIKDGQNGKYFSLSVKEMEPVAGSKQPQLGRIDLIPEEEPVNLDDIPF